MNQKIKERQEALKQREEALKQAMNKEGGTLKRQVSRVWRVALGAGILSLVLYWIFGLFGRPSAEEDKSPPIQKQNPSFSGRLAKVLTPYLIKFVANFIEENLRKKR